MFPSLSTTFAVVVYLDFPFLFNSSSIYSAYFWLNVYSTNKSTLGGIFKNSIDCLYTSGKYLLLSKYVSNTIPDILSAKL